MKNPLMTAVALCGLAAAAHAEGQPHTRDGLFLAFGLGFGYGSLTTEGTMPTYSGSSLKMKMDNTGLNNSFDFRIGGTVAEDFALHGTLIGDVIEGPKTKITIDGQSASGDAFNSVGFSLVGAGGTKYFAPHDIFVSASGGVATFQAESKDGDKGKVRDRGFGLQAKAGKEWWVSPNWALGASAVVNWATVSPTNETDKYLSVGAQFSATYW